MFAFISGAWNSTHFTALVTMWNVLPLWAQTILASNTEQITFHINHVIPGY
jgi:hypothetical protein